MTIAIGFCGDDGLVLAADSQETIGGYTKGNRGKIETIVLANRNVLAFVGSREMQTFTMAATKDILPALLARSAGGAIVVSPARSEAECRDTGTKIEKSRRDD